MRKLDFSVMRYCDRNGAPTFVYEVLQRLRHLNTKYVSRPAMEPELGVELQRKFHPEVQRLSELLGWDLHDSLNLA